MSAYDSIPQYPSLLTLYEIDAAYHINAAKLHAAIKSGKLPCWRIGYPPRCLYVCEVGQVKQFIETYKPRRLYRTKARVASGEVEAEDRKTYLQRWYQRKKQEEKK